MEAVDSFPRWDSFMKDLSDLIDEPTATVKDDTGEENGVMCDLDERRLQRTQELVEALRSGKNGLDSIIGDRRYRLRTYPKCFGMVLLLQTLEQLSVREADWQTWFFVFSFFFFFFSLFLFFFFSAISSPFSQCAVGKDFVSFLVKKNFVPSVDAAVEFGKLLLRLGLIHHVVNEHDFKNDELFYRFRSDDSTEDQQRGPTVAQLSIGCNVAKMGPLETKLPLFGWKQIFALLRADTCTLYEFASELAPEPSRIIKISKCTARVQEDNLAKKGTYGFSVTLENETFHYCAQKSKDQEAWYDSYGWLMNGTR